MIFVFGAGRSGTTWLGKIFDSHPDVVYRHEPDIALRSTEVPFRVTRDEIERYREAAALYVDALCATRDIRAAGSLPVFGKSYRGPLRRALVAGYVYAVKALQRPFGAVDAIEHARVPELIPAAARSRCRTVVKSVSSLGRALLFARAKPGTKIVHIVRHPCGVVSSRLRGIELNVMPADPFVAEMAETPEARRYGLTLEKLQSLSFEEQLAIHWMVQNEQTIADFEDDPDYRLVIYEDLCRRPKEETRDLFAFCGLDWNAQTDAFLQACINHEGGRERYFQTIRSPIKAAFKWRNELAEDQIARIMNVVGGSAPGRLFGV